MNLANKLKMAMTATETTQVELSRRIGQEQANLSRKLRADNFNVNDYEKMVNALGCTLRVEIILPDGRII